MKYEDSLLVLKTLLRKENNLKKAYIDLPPKSDEENQLIYPQCQTKKSIDLPPMSAMIRSYEALGFVTVNPQLTPYHCP